MKQARREDVHVAVPKTGGDDEAFAVNYFCIARSFEGRGWTDGDDVAVVDKDGTVFDGFFCWRGINLCADQSEVIGANVARGEEYYKQEKDESDSHNFNIRVR